MTWHCSQAVIDALLEEDCPYMDLTVEALGIGQQRGILTCFAKQDCVLAGVEVAVRLLKTTGCTVRCDAASGMRLEAGRVFLHAEGTAAALHRGLKIAQNVMEYASGIASRSAALLARARAVNPKIQLAVTRKHCPATKGFSLAAAQAGGAIVHRLGLSDSILVFDQHRVFTNGIEGFAKEAARYRAVFPERILGAEVATPEEALLLAQAGVDSIQCERFTCDALTQTVQAVKACNPQALVLAAGGIHADNAASVAATGVDVLVTSWVYFGKPGDITMQVAMA